MLLFPFYVSSSFSISSHPLGDEILINPQTVGISAINRNGFYVFQWFASFPSQINRFIYGSTTDGNIRWTERGRTPSGWMRLIKCLVISGGDKIESCRRRSKSSKLSQDPLDYPFKPSLTPPLKCKINESCSAQVMGDKISPDRRGVSIWMANVDTVDYFTRLLFFALRVK